MCPVWVVIWETETQTALVNFERHCLSRARICLDSLNSGRILEVGQRSAGSEVALHAGLAIERRDAIADSDADNSFRCAYLVFARDIISELNDGFSSTACLRLAGSSGTKYFSCDAGVLYSILLP